MTNSISERLCRSLVFARAGGRCERCGAGNNLSYHHRKKRSQGGGWDAFNIVLVCGSGTTGCHGWIEHHANQAEAEGFHVRPWEDPEYTPIKLNRQNWYELLPDGEIVDSGPRELAPDEGDLYGPGETPEMPPPWETE